MFQVRREFVLALQLLLNPLPALDHNRYPLHDVVRVEAESLKYLRREVVAVLKDSHEEVRGVDLIPPPPLRLIHRKLEDVPGRVGYLDPGFYRVLAWYAEVFIEEAEYLPAINLEVLHNLHKED